MGANTVRLRVFVNPPTYGFWIKPDREIKGHRIEGGLVMLGFCDQDSVVSMAARVKQHGMKLMVDFHTVTISRIRYSRIFPRNGLNWIIHKFARRWQNIPTQYCVH